MIAHTIKVYEQLTDARLREIDMIRSNWLHVREIHHRCYLLN